MASYKTRNGNGETEMKRNQWNRKPHPKYWFWSADHAACCAGLNCSFKYERPQRL